MTQSVLTADVVAMEALAQLENNLTVLNTFYRDLESEYSKSVNGYKKGSAIRIRRPHDPRPRTGATMAVQDVEEGYVGFSVDQQIGHDFRFSSEELTLDIRDLGDRVIKPAIENIVNEIVADCMETFYPAVYNWAGTAGQTINSFADFMKGPERLNEMAVPVSERYAALSPADHAALIGFQTSLPAVSDAAKMALRDASLGRLAGIEVNMAQFVPAHLNGTADNTTPLTRGTSNTTTYSDAKNTWTMTLSTDGWDNSATITKGTVFTIAGVYMVNPKTKRATDILQQFTVTEAVTAASSSSNETQLTISPPIITSGVWQTVDSAPGNDKAITVVGSASTSYRQNLLYHRNAFALAVVPMEIPAGTVDASRQSSKGLSVRVVPTYDGTNDVSAWRLDILYGRKTIDPRLATRLSGTSN